MANETLNDFEQVPKGERVRIALSASYQIEALMSALVRASLKEEPEALDQLVQSIGTRAYELSGLIMGALHDESETRENLNLKLNLNRR